MKGLIKFAKVAIPIGLAVYLMFKTFEDPMQRAELFRAMGRANYLWVILSMVIAWFSHAIRSRRWSYLMEPLGYKTRFWNAYHAIMAGYLINMAIPRAGEVSRAGLFAKAEKLPMDQAFGTIAAERVVDLLILLGITGLTVLSQYDIIWGAIESQFLANRATDTDPSGLYIKGGIALLVIIIGFFIVKKLELMNKIRGFIRGIIEGLKTIYTTPHKWAFTRDTILIWLAYLLMFGIMFQCLPDSINLGPGAMLAGFVFGSFAVVLTPGGTGAYHLAVGFALSFYGLQESTGQALGLIMWGSQTILYILLGFLSLLLLPIYNREYSGHTSLSTAETS